MNATSGNHATEQLRESRRALNDLLFEDADDALHFPRSKTLRLLLNHRTAALVGIGGTLLLLKPRWVGSALRILPMNSVLRLLANRLLNRG